MSVSLSKIFSNALNFKLLRLPFNTVFQARLITAMEVAKVDEKETDRLLSDKKFTRYRKRQWEFKKERNDETETKKVCDGDKPVVERIKKKKMAMLLGYCGVDYFGMQRNPGVPTIEEELLKALLDVKYITEEDFKNQQNAQFQRSSRTDKGVSAARQVVSLKLPLEVNIEEINKRLPDCIRVFGVKRVTNKFNSKGKCNARTYSYTLPTYVFEPSLKTLEERKQYRITPEKLQQVNNILEVYKGTKSYHNFTEKKYHTDPSSSRYMMSFAVEKVFVESDMEFAVLLVKGQSFMLHQIRKMIGLTIAVVRGHTDMSMMDRAFSKDKIIIPTAPGLGLVLDMVHYDRYDTKFKGSHDSLTWEEAEGTIQKFKHEFIYPVIVKTELEDDSMAEWMHRKLEQHSYEPSEDGTVDKNEQKEIELAGDDDEDDEIKEHSNDDEIKEHSNDDDIKEHGNDVEIKHGNDDDDVSKEKENNEKIDSEVTKSEVKESAS